MNFLCPACRTPLPGARASVVVPCSACGVQVDLARVETAPGTARLSPEVDLTGEALGGFRLLKQLGAGGMGTVYAAKGAQGPCAVKVLSSLVAADPAVRERFRREAEALRQVQHPAVVRILAEGEEQGFCWYAMERVDGPDLRARLAEGPLPWPEVEGLARRVLSALGAAHARGFVHRDVKPSNLLLAKDGAKLCDFGIARLNGATTLTASAALIGSLRYMAPEQQRLGRAGPQSDLYSLGLVLHEALAGGLPGERALPARVPRHLRRLLAKLLAERPEERPLSARAALKLLERRVPVAVVSVGVSTALALVAFLALGVLGPGASTPPSPTAQALKKDPAPAARVTKEAPVTKQTPEPSPPIQQAQANEQQQAQTNLEPTTNVQAQVPQRTSPLSQSGEEDLGLGGLSTKRGGGLRGTKGAPTTRGKKVLSTVKEDTPVAIPQAVPEPKQSLRKSAPKSQRLTKESAPGSD